MKKKKLNQKMLLILCLLFFLGSTISALEPGDVNCDGITNIVDALLIAQHYVGMNVPIQQCSQPVVFNNRSFEYHIRYLIDKKGGILETRELTSVEAVDFSEAPNQDYSDFQYLTGLKRLNLSFCELTDISVLENCPFIEDLDLSMNFLKDLSALNKLEYIQSLKLFGNQITDLSNFPTLKMLKELDLSSNNITDLTPLEKLSALETLDIRHNPITSLKGLEKLISLKHLNISSIKSINSDQSDFFPGIEELTALNNSITKLDLFSNLYTLTRLDLSLNPVDESELSQLKNLVNLKELVLSDCSLKDISELEELKKLSISIIKLNKNSITDFSSLKDFENLTELNLDANPISMLPDMSNLGSLEFFSAASTHLMDITGLEKCVQLKKVYIDNTRVSDISALLQLPALEIVHLYRTPISHESLAIVNKLRANGVSVNF